MTTIIGILTRSFNEDYVAPIVHGVQDVAQEQGAKLLIIHEAPGYLATTGLSTGLVDGWILPVYLDDCEQLMRTGKPCVTIAAYDPALGCPAVLADNYGGFKGAVEHLIEHGHHAIAFAGSLDEPDFRERFRGYQDALQEHGLPVDQQLLLLVSHAAIAYGYAESVGGPDIAVRLIAAGMPCTALVTPSDDVAIEVMEQLQAAGYRLPEDLAVVSFDDISRAQLCSPPLTTVRQNPRMLGQIGARQLLSQLRGGEPQSGPVYAPTALIVRQSCGCGPAAQPHLQSQPGAAAGQQAGWSDTLVRELLALLMQPLSYDPSMRPGDICPGTEELVGALALVLEGQQPPPAELQRQAWRQIAQLNRDPAVAMRALSLLERAALRQLGQRGAALEAWEDVQSFLQGARELLLQTYLRPGQAASSEHLLHEQTDYRVKVAMLNANAGGALSLGWLEHAFAEWGLVALADDQAADAPLSLKLAGVYAADPSQALPLGQRYPAELFPPRELLESDLPGEQQGVSVVVPLQVAGGRPALLALHGVLGQQISFSTNMMWKILLERDLLLSSLIERGVSLQAALSTLEQRNQELSEARAAAEQANQLKSQFLASMSHELRTPLNAILNFSYYMGDPELGHLLSDEQRGMQQRVIANADHLLGLINDLLDLAKIEAGKMTLQLEQFELPPLLKSVMATAAGLTRDKPIALKLELAEPLPALRADQTRLRQVLLNLLSNAVKFTERGTISLEVRHSTDDPSTDTSTDAPDARTSTDRHGPARTATDGHGHERALSEQPATSNQQPATQEGQPATSNPGISATSNQQPATSNQQPATQESQRSTINDQRSTITFTVRDTGIGIPSEALGLIFEQFRQLDGQLARQHRGTGLGLPISRRIVELHGGCMGVESEPGAGSTFWFSLPLAPDSPA